jgi:hypothetical protein
MKPGTKRIIPKSFLYSASGLIFLILWGIQDHYRYQYYPIRPLFPVSESGYVLPYLANVTLTQQKIEQEFVGGILENVTFDEVYIHGSHFLGIGLKNVIFQNCVIENTTFLIDVAERVVFDHCVLRSVQFRENHSNSAQKKIIFRNTSLFGIYVYQADNWLITANRSQLYTLKLNSVQNTRLELNHSVIDQFFSNSIDDLDLVNNDSRFGPFFNFWESYEYYHHTLQKRIQNSFLPDLWLSIQNFFWGLLMVLGSILG